MKTSESSQDLARKAQFRRNLLRWHREANLRVLPWKEESSPYRIWLSEIILQQTRAAQGIPYYQAFISAYPELEDLASAPEQDVMKLWQGLGYYARCRNMLATAKQLVSEFGGKFPNTYDELLRLKGIGPYTAAAIASFAFGRPHAVVDGNVYRVLARHFALDLATDGTEGKKLFQALADELLDASCPAEYNQAIMDFGAAVCVPANPDCGNCPLSSSCLGFAQGLVDRLPRPKVKAALKYRYFHYLLLHWNGHIWLRQRQKNDIWKGLYEPFMIETPAPLNGEALLLHDDVHYLGLVISGEEVRISQRLSHQVIESRFFSIHSGEKPDMPEDGVWVSLPELRQFPLPATPVKFFEKKGYF